MSQNKQIIINQGFELQSYNLQGLGIIPIKEYQILDVDSVLGKAMLKLHPGVCKEYKGTLLTEEPICTATVQEEESIKEIPLEKEFIDEILEESEEHVTTDALIDEALEKAIWDIKPLEEFNKDKSALEEYARETFNVELDKRKGIQKMYDALVLEVESK